MGCDVADLERCGLVSEMVSVDSNGRLDNLRTWRAQYDSIVDDRRSLDKFVIKNFSLDGNLGTLIFHRVIRPPSGWLGLGVRAPDSPFEQVLPSID